MTGKSFLRLPLRLFLYRVLPALLLTLIPMGLSSQNSEPKSNNSNAILRTWEQISGKFQNELTALRQDLQAALSDAQQSTISLQKSTGLYESSLTRIANLETINSQIGERMQERDQDLAAAYDDLGRQDGTILRLIIAVIVLGIPYIVMLAVWAAKKGMGRT
jgi:hypothetical protein